MTPRREIKRIHEHQSVRPAWSAGRKSIMFHDTQAVGCGGDRVQSLGRRGGEAHTHKKRR